MRRHIWIFLGLVAVAAIAWAGLANKAAVFDGIVETKSGGYMFPDGTLQTTGIVVAAASQTFEFVGTTTAITPDHGVLGLARHCQSEFGTGSRMCTSEEILMTSALPAPSAWQTQTAWVQLVAVGVSVSSTPFVVDVSGIARDYRDLNCIGWSVATAQGLGLVTQAPTPDQEGTFGQASCDTPAGVACCGPSGS